MLRVSAGHGLRLLLPVAFVSLVVASGGAARPSAGAVTITGGPSGETTETSATFTFDLGRAAEPSLTQCGLDGSTSRCSSPQSYSGLALGRHVFTVRAFDPDGNDVGSDERIWTIVAPPPPSPPPPPPPPSEPPPPSQPPPPTQPPPSGLDARLSAPASAAPGGLVTLDASASTGEIASVRFDLDGNGSFETKCGAGSKAGAVYAGSGTYDVGVMVVSNGGETDVGSAKVVVGGASVPPPAGSKALPAGSIAGGCQKQVTPDALVSLILGCPETVVLGVAEAVAMSGCFQRTFVSKPEPREIFVAKKGFGAFVNGIRVNPSSGASITLDATIKRIYLTGDSAAKARLWIYRGSPSVSVETVAQYLDWAVGSPSIVGTFDGKQGNSFLGLASPKFSAPLSLTAGRRARLAVGVALPYPFKEVASGKVTLETDNTDGPLITSFTAAFGDVPLGIFEVRDAKLAYSRQGKDDVWAGGLTLAFPPPGSPIVAKGTLGLRNGSFDNASASFEKPTPGFGPIGCCVWMTKFGGTLKTSEIAANATFTAGPAIAGKALVSLDGALKVYLNSFLVSAKGTIAVVGIPVANGSVTITDNSLYALGSISKTFAGVLEAKATVAGGLYTDGSWHMVGNGGLCIDTQVKEFCAGGGVALSSKGVAGCVTLSAAAVGAVVYWNGGWNIFWSCSFGTLKSKVGASSLEASTTAGSAAAATDIELRPGLTRALISLRGAGDAPSVRVEGPDGTTFEVPGPEGNYAETSRLFVLRLPQKRTTDIVLVRPAAGRWRITPLPGSAPIVSVGQADPLPARPVTATLAGAGYQRTLRFSARPEKGQRVSFVERAPGIEHLVGRTGAASGELRFIVADGPAGPRRIDAVVESDGFAVRTETVARFRAPRPLVLPAPRVVAVRTARGISVRWSAVPGAVAYRARIALADGTIATSLLKRDRRSVAVPAGTRTSAEVSVRALSTAYRDGRAARARVGALPGLAAPPSVSLASLRRARVVVVTCDPAADGTCALRATVRERTIGGGSAKVAYARPAKVRVRLTAAALRLLRPGDTLVLSAVVPGDGPRSVRSRVR